MTINYIDTDKLTAELVAWKKEVTQYASDMGCSISELKAESLPPVNTYIGQSILDIANRYATKHNFSGYSYKDEMISDGVLQSLKMIKNFDETKVMRNGQSASAFNYISLIIFQSFLRRIQKEKHQQHIKNKSLVEHSLEDLMNDIEHLGLDSNQPTEFLQTIYNDHLQRHKEYEEKLGITGNNKKPRLVKNVVKKRNDVKSLF